MPRIISYANRGTVKAAVAKLGRERTVYTQPALTGKVEKCKTARCPECDTIDYGNFHCPTCNQNHTLLYSNKGIIETMDKDKAR